MDSLNQDRRVCVQKQSLEVSREEELAETYSKEELEFPVSRGPQISDGFGSDLGALEPVSPPGGGSPL